QRKRPAVRDPGRGTAVRGGPAVGLRSRMGEGPSVAADCAWIPRIRRAGAGHRRARTVAPARLGHNPIVFDLVIRSGTVVDGSGGPGVRADVGIRNGLIEAVGDLAAAEAARSIDAAGLTV